MDRASSVVGIPLEVVVVLDSCSDGTAAVTRAAARTLASRVHTVSIDARNVGTARRLGMARLLDILDPADAWVSTTDADSVVPGVWFRRQLAYRAAGVAMVAGTVHVVQWEDRLHLRLHYERQYVADGCRHVHGANLSFRASSYQRAGGFADVTSDEDVALVAAFREADQEIAWAADLSVATSARRVGRAPRGFAGYLNQMTLRFGAGACELEAR